MRLFHRTNHAEAILRLRLRPVVRPSSAPWWRGAGGPMPTIGAEPHARRTCWLRTESPGRPRGRTTLWRQDTARHALQRPCNEEWPMPDARRHEHRSEDARRVGAQPPRSLGTRRVLAADESVTAREPSTMARAIGPARRLRWKIRSMQWFVPLRRRPFANYCDLWCPNRVTSPSAVGVVARQGEERVGICSIWRVSDDSEPVSKRSDRLLPRRG
jgi:hypothetical protein